LDRIDVPQAAFAGRCYPEIGQSAVEPLTDPFVELTEVLTTRMALPPFAAGTVLDALERRLDLLDRRTLPFRWVLHLEQPVVGDDRQPERLRDRLGRLLCSNRRRDEKAIDIAHTGEILGIGQAPGGSARLLMAEFGQSPIVPAPPVRV